MAAMNETAMHDAEVQGAPHAFDSDDVLPSIEPSPGAADQDGVIPNTGNSPPGAAGQDGVIPNAGNSPPGAGDSGAVAPSMDISAPGAGDNPILIEDDGSPDHCDSDYIWDEGENPGRHRWPVSNNSNSFHGDPTTIPAIERGVMADLVSLKTFSDHHIF